MRSYSQLLDRLCYRATGRLSIRFKYIFSTLFGLEGVIATGLAVM